MILPIYNKQERNDLKKELKAISAWLDNNESKKNTQIYKDKEAKEEQIYEIINDL